MKREEIFFGLLRLGLGWIFLWAFLDKLFGLGYATPSDKSWLSGVSPTAGFLRSASGVLAPIFNNLSGSTAVDWLFMLGLGLTGLALVLGIGMKISCHAGALQMFLIWLSVLPPKQNPFLDEHIIYILILLLLVRVRAGDYLGLGRWWRGTKPVKHFSLIE